MTRHAPTRLMMLPLLMSVASAPAVAGGLPSQFTLSNAVPDDVFFFVHGAYNEEHAWMEAEWGKVFEAFKKSGIIDDVLQLITSNVPADKRAQVDQTITQFSELIGNVDWGAMLEREVVFSESFAGLKNVEGDFFAPSYAMLARGRKGTGPANADALLAIFNHAAAMSNGSVEFAARQLHGVNVWSVPVGGTSADFRFEMFQHGDVIGLAFGRGGADKAIGMLTGNDKSRSIVDSPRFKEAYGKIAKRITPEDMVMFVDIRRILGDVRGLVEMATAKDKDNPEVKSARDIMSKVMSLVDVSDYAIAAMATDGRQQKTIEMFALQPGKQDSMIGRLCTESRPFTKFDQFIPADATDFAAHGSINLELIYDTVIEFIRDDIPEGAGYITKWNEWLAKVNFDPKRDVFSWLSGETISITMPPAVVSAMGGPDSVSFIRVKDAELAKQKIDTAIAFLNRKMKDLPPEAQAQSMGMMAPINFTPATGVSAEGFKELQHPMLMMMGLRPVMGFTDNWLVFGNSAAAVNKCLAVASGEAESIRSNERFREEGLIPDGPCKSVTFTDTSNLGQELAAAVGGIGMMGPMIVGMMPDEKELREIKPILMKSFGILAKLSPVLQQIDFYSSEASLTTIEGNEMWTKSVVTYKPRKTADSR